MLRSFACVVVAAAAASAQSQLQWLATRDYPSNYVDYGRWCAVDASGATFVAGQVYVQQPGFPPPPPTADFALSKFDASGAHVWSAQADVLGGQDFAYDLALAPDGSIYVAGYASGTGGGIPALLKFQPSGALEWSRTYSLPGFARAVAVDSAGDVIIAGHAFSATSGNDVLLAKYDASGALLWDRRLDGGSNSADNGYGLLLDSNDEIFVACGLAISGDSDFGVLRYGTDGTLLWSIALDGGSGGSDAATHLVRSGALIFAGGFRTAANEDWMVVQFAASTGFIAGSQFHAGPGGASERVRSMAVDSSGAVWATGSHSSASQGIDIAVRRYDASGTLLASATWNNSLVNGDDSPFKLLVGGEDQAWVVGYSQQATSGPSSYDIQVLQFDRTGAFNWAANYSTPGAADDRAWDAELGPGATLRVSGYSNGGGTGNYDFLAASIDYSQSPHGYCTAKINTLGCSPAMSFSGVPSASASSGFVVSCSKLRNQKSGLVFYSTLGAASTPFQGGFFCMQAPTRRTPIGVSGGSAPPADDCSGALALDMNAYAASGADPALSVAGAGVWSQTWSRDPGAAFNTSLSNALAYVVGP